MKILVASKFWYVRGGLERVMFDEIAGLEELGHEVGHFSTAHANNLPSPWSGFFVEHLDLGSDASLSLGRKVSAAGKMFDNRAAARNFEALLEEFAPDVVHVHGIHRQISPSILPVAWNRGVPVVQTVHDYHHICPADVLLKGGESPCEPRECGTYYYGAAIRHRCVRGSLAASALSALETGYQRMRHVYERCVGTFVCPSRFLADRMQEAGWSIPCEVIPNSVVADMEASEPGEYFLYAGRLSPEKGIEVFLDAVRRCGVRAVVAGSGPLAKSLAADYPDIRFVGHVSTSEVGELISRARAAVVPSVCFENAPLSVLEPMAKGVPVIASAIGGIPELVDDETTGILVRPAAVEDLMAAISRLHEDDVLTRRLGEAARVSVSERFSPERHTNMLLGVYERIRRPEAVL